MSDKPKRLVMVRSPYYGQVELEVSEEQFQKITSGSDLVISMSSSSPQASISVDWLREKMDYAGS